MGDQGGKWSDRVACRADPNIGRLPHELIIRRLWGRVPFPELQNAQVENRVELFGGRRDEMYPAVVRRRFRVRRDEAASGRCSRLRSSQFHHNLPSGTSSSLLKNGSRTKIRSPMAGVADVDSLIVSEASQSGPTVASRLPAGRQLGSEPSPSRGPMAWLLPSRLSRCARSAGEIRASWPDHAQEGHLGLWRCCRLSRVRCPILRSSQWARSIVLPIRELLAS